MKPPPPTSGQAVDWHELTHQKLMRIFGPDKAEMLMSRTLLVLELERIDSVDDIERFARALEEAGPMELAAASMLRMAVTLVRVRHHDPSEP